MDNTGRITKPLRKSARRIAFGSTIDGAIDAELAFMLEIDTAHFVMLVETGLLPDRSAGRVLRAIDELRASDLSVLRGELAPRGLYVLYEDCLRASLPEADALQWGASRNDKGATVVRLRLRSSYLRLMRRTSVLQAALLKQAMKWSNITMPAYTNGVAAQPISFGHYLTGIASALERDLDGLEQAGSLLNACPLGAGAVAGTSLPINVRRTCELLGFTTPVFHSVDAVASRDFALRLLAAGAVLGVTLSRMASDLLHWLTPEYGFLRVPDCLVTSSSMMPQKRNPYLLELALGRSATAIGALTTLATAMHGTPFSNSATVSTETARQVFTPLRDLADSADLLRIMIRGVEPQVATMLERARNGYTAATALADRLTIRNEGRFRDAHHEVGKIVTAAIASGGLSLEQAAYQWFDSKPPVPLDGLDPASVARAAEHGGGPGSASQKVILNRLSEALSNRFVRIKKVAHQWRTAADRLRQVVNELCGTAVSSLSSLDSRDKTNQTDETANSSVHCPILSKNTKEDVF
jgi:argininosuccinate lyase